MDWTPAKREPSGFDLSLIDAIRAAALPAAAIGTVRIDPDGVLVYDRTGSQQLRAVLQIIDETHIQHGERAARRIRFDGRAVVGGHSLVLTATAILDRATAAFLDVDFEILSRS